MKLLLDTCSFLWLASGSPELSAAARQAIAVGSNSLHLSAISITEVHRLVRARRIQIQAPKGLETWLRTALQHHGIQVEPIGFDIAHQAEMLPPLHADPADRFIIATALVGGHTLVTPDKMIAQYLAIQVLW